MDNFIELCQRSIESRKRFMEYVVHSMSFDYVQAFEDYANSLDKDCDELTKDEKQQAVLDAVLKVHND